MMKKFKISVVMPVYNVERYLEEAIDSVINQTLGFEENIQLILVNDGSPDNSEKICLMYKNLYPDNIIYIKQENMGVSAARNRGKKEAVGKYLNFFDSDDIWELDSYLTMYNFMEKHFEEIDLVSCRLEFFGNRNNSHPLNFKYEEDVIVDINENPDFIQLSASSALIKTAVLADVNFDTTLAFSEDALLLTQLIIEKCRYGVVRDAVYYYRRREEENSAIQRSVISHAWYFDTPKKSYQYLIDHSKEKYNEVLKYIQYYVMYDIQWRLKTPFPDSFSTNLKIEYVEIITKLLQSIDDDIIFKQKNITSEFKLYALELKYGHKVNNKLTLENSTVYYGKYRIHSLTHKAFLKINILEFIDGVLILDGQLRTILADNKFSFYAKDSFDKEYPIKLVKNHLSSVQGIDREVLYSSTFHLEIPISNQKPIDISLYIRYENNDPVRLRYSFQQHAKLSTSYKVSYFKDEKIIFSAGPSIIRVIPRTMSSEIRSRLRSNWDLLKKKKFKAILLKVFVFLSSIFIKKPIWLVSDRLSFANDNGYHLFKFINKNQISEINSYFVLDKNSEDYSKMKAIGKVVSYKSLKYKILFLLSDKVISSSAEDWVINPFKGGREMYKGLYTFDFVFLQHGITKDDLSIWLNKLHKNIKLFVTAANGEYNSIVNGAYGYTEEEVKLVGFPRYDNLINKPERKVVIMPTWRKSLVGKDSMEIAGEREYNNNFKNSDYFQFFNGLINHPKLLEVFEKYDYTGEFVIHPSHLKQDVDFDENNIFSINSGFADYQKYFSESSLLITDYSSVVMDFAYLNKPAIYTHFDKDTFFGQHTYTEGYFDYERDGFGPICYDLESTVSTIISKIENGCQQEIKYEKRINSFYKYHDQNNCKRVFEAILKIK